MFEVKKCNDKIELKGRLDTTTAPEFEKYCKEEINTLTENIFDFAQLEYISSAGLRVILSMKKKCDKDGGNIILINVSEENREIFEVTGFDQVLDIE